MQEQNEQLSERELEILRLVATGAANKEIARMLVISPNTVKVHLRNIFAKIGVSTRTEATLYAIQIGLINPGMADTVLAQPAPEATPGSAPLPVDPGPSNGASVQSAEYAPLPEIRVTDSQPGLRRQSLRPWQLALAVIVVLLIVGSGIVSARVLLAPTAQPTLTVAANVIPPVIQSQRWQPQKELPAPRKGMGFAEYEGCLYVVAGETEQGIDNGLLCYQIEANQWQTLQEKPTPVTDVQAALLGERIYVPGGQLTDGKASDLLEVYNPRQDTWEKKAPLPVPLSGYALAAFEGRLYLFGGKQENQYLSTVYIYDPQEDRWREGSPMSAPRAFAGAAVEGGKIHILGGYDGKTALSDHLAYFPSRDVNDEPAWETLTALPYGRYAMGVVNLANLIFLVGGIGEEGTNQSAPLEPLQYSVKTGEWMTFDAPSKPVGAYPGLLASGNFLYMVGGETSAGISTDNLSYQAIYTISVPFLRDDE